MEKGTVAVMKSLMKIYSRYLLIACLLIIVLVSANILFLVGSILHYATYYRGSLLFGNMESIAEEIICSEQENSGYPYVSEEGIRLIQQNNYCFAFIISPKGDVIWEWKVPKELPAHYSPGDISAFSKWYLQDYPVKTWRYGESLLVCGQPRNSAWKYCIEFPQIFMERLDLHFKWVLIVNFAVLIFALLFIGYRYYASLRPLAQGIHTLAEGNILSLPERGVVAELCGKLNQVSYVLKGQREALAKRDDARTEWISGISHDIRTPLSMIMGYADSLSGDSTLTEEQRRQAGIIKHQSLVIKKLIEDLNLTSKLEYHMQPMRITRFPLAPFLRSLAAGYLNDGLGSGYDIELNIADNFGGFLIEGDEVLLNRAMNNLIGNSIRHNPGGCRIRISASLLSDNVCSVGIRDNGTGIPEQVIEVLEGKAASEDSRMHIMGLRIARQIILSHHGNFYFSTDKHGIIMEIPVIKEG